MTTPTMSRLGELSEQPRTLEAIARFVNTLASHRTIGDAQLAKAIARAQMHLDAMLLPRLDDRGDGFISELARGLARDCAQEAIEAGGGDPTDCDGNCLLPTEPLAGDWDALTKLLGHWPTDDECNDFAGDYMTVMAAQRERNQAEKGGGQ